MTSSIDTLRARAERQELLARADKARAVRRAIAAATRPSARPRSPRLAPIAAPSPVAMLGSYEAAVPAHGRPPLRGSPGSAVSHWDQSTADRVRWACQHAERNSPTVRALCKAHQALVVGDGAIVRSLSGDGDWAQKADALFSAWADADHTAGLGVPDACGSRSLWQICRLIDKAWLVDGDVLAVQLGQASVAPGCVQLVEADRIRAPSRSGRQGAQAAMVDGVEVDPLGRPLRFAVCAPGRYGAASGAAQTVDAEHATLLCNPFDDRVGMVRGEPAIQASLARIRRLDEYAEKHALAAHIATLFALIAESDRPADLQAGLEGIETQPPADGPGTIPMEAGSMIFARRGEKFTQVDPKAPNTNYADYVRAELGQIAADVGLPICLAFFDPSELSYIVMRAQAAVAMRGFYHAQALLAAFVRRVRAWKIGQWMDEGRLATVPDFARAEVNFPDAPVFDLGAEVTAYRDAVAANLITQDQATQALGSGKARDVNESRAVEVSQQRALRIEPLAPPGSKSAGAAS